MSPSSVSRTSDRSGERKASVSIVITSYNYQQYVAAAVESALRQTVPCEVVVVDDGSTDGSLDVLHGYRPAAKVIAKENGGHASAILCGLQHTTGEWIIFLDSDDLLDPACVEAVLAHVTPEATKIQYRLAVIDSAGVDVHTSFPDFSSIKGPADILKRSLDTGAYPCPVTSGNAYARRYLDRLLPIVDPRFKNDIEPYLNGLAPLYGEVVSVSRVLGAYRVHGRNLWARADQTSSWSKYLQHRVDSQQLFEEHARRLAFAVPRDALLRSTAYLECRMLSLRLTPENHPVPRDMRTRLLARSIMTALRSSELSLLGRLAWTGYFVFIGLMPVAQLRRVLPGMRGAGARRSWARIAIGLSRMRLRSAGHRRERGPREV